MSCNCSEKLGMSFFVHQRIWIAASRLVSPWCSGIKLWWKKVKFKFLFQVGVLILCLSSMLKIYDLCLNGVENQPRCFLCFFKSSTNSLFPYHVFPPQSSVRWASFQQTQKRLFSSNFAEVFIFSLSGNWCGHYLFYSFISIGVRRYIDQISIDLSLNIL